MPLGYVLVALGGALDAPDRVRQRLIDWFGEPTYVIAADSGYDRLLGMGIRADCVLGDMDSVVADAGLDAERRIVFPAEKDQTDSELALEFAAEYAAEHAISRIVVVGYAGSRHDHMLANFQLFTTFSARYRGGDRPHLDFVLVDAVNRIEFAASDRPAAVLPRYSRFVSVVPVADSLSISIDGAKYPLERATIRYGQTLGISNEHGCAEETMRVTVHSGSCLIVWSDDPATDPATDSAAGRHKPTA